MKTGYAEINLTNMLSELKEEGVKSILSSFSCPLNRDVEQFLLYKATEFAKQGIAATHLVFASYKERPVLVGYYTLANKYIFLKSNSLSNTMRKRINKFATYIPETKQHVIAAPLIGQIGKNYTNNYNRLITGDELLKLACDRIERVQLNIGGKIVYLECEDKPVLIDFYSQNGFVSFGKRALESDETELMDGKYLIQMLKYIKTK